MSFLEAQENSSAKKKKGIDFFNTKKYFMYFYFLKLANVCFKVG
jgi:hypothetical protein